MIAAHAHHLQPAMTTRHGYPTWGPRLIGMRTSAVEWLRQSLCGLRGHAMMMHFESTRLSLQCASCGRNTPGWAIHQRS